MGKVAQETQKLVLEEKKSGRGEEEWEIKEFYNFLSLSEF